MIIKVGLEENKAIEKVKNYVSELKTKKDLHDKLLVIEKNETTIDNVNYKIKNYELKLQSEDALWTGSNVVICKIRTVSYVDGMDRYFLNYSNEEPMNADDIWREIRKIIY